MYRCPPAALSTSVFFGIPPLRPNLDWNHAVRFPSAAASDARQKRGSSFTTMQRKSLQHILLIFISAAALTEHPALHRSYYCSTIPHSTTTTQQKHREHTRTFINPPVPNTGKTHHHMVPFLSHTSKYTITNTYIKIFRSMSTWFSFSVRTLPYPSWMFQIFRVQQVRVRLGGDYYTSRIAH